MLARTRPWRVVLVCDLSCLMQLPYLAPNLYLERAVVLRQDLIRSDGFAFSTSLIRITSVLAHR